jgi:hypothetical protein
MSTSYGSSPPPGDRPATEPDSAPSALGGSRDATRSDAAERTTEPDAREDPVAAVDRHEVVAREKDAYGGIKFGSAFFGWLTATGTAVLLTAILAGAGTAIGVAANTTVGEATTAAQTDTKTVGIAGGVALLVILFVAYYCGGYVAARMARFNGIKQGIAVWVWGVLIAIVVAIVAAAAGSKYNILGRLNSFPRIPVDEGNVTTGGVLALLIVAAAALAGAMLGGLAGMRFHRNVDKAGLGR